MINEIRKFLQERRRMKEQEIILNEEANKMKKFSNPGDNTMEGIRKNKFQVGADSLISKDYVIFKHVDGEMAILSEQEFNQTIMKRKSDKMWSDLMYI